VKGSSVIIDKATIVKNGTLTGEFAYLKEYSEESR